MFVSALEHLARGDGVVYAFDYEISCLGVTRSGSSGPTYNTDGLAPKPNELGFGFLDFFELGPMGGRTGRDAAAWAAKGLPAEGEITVEVTVSNVRHISAAQPVIAADAPAGPADVETDSRKRARAEQQAGGEGAPCVCAVSSACWGLMSVVPCVARAL